MHIIRAVLLWTTPLWISLKRIWISLKQILPTYLWLDLNFFIKIVRYSQNIDKSVDHCPSAGMLDVFLKQVSIRPDQAFILYQDETFTFKDIELKSNQAAWALRQHAKLKKGDCVALFTFNEPAYIWIWLALAKLGCPMACLNYNIRAESFLHSFKCSGAKVLIATPELRNAVEEVLPRLLEEGVLVYFLNRDSLTGTHSLLDKVEAASEDPIPESYRSGISSESPTLFLYTSGTTGLPKAAMFSQKGVLFSCIVTMLCDLESTDVLYVTTPLYHATGLLVGVRGCIQSGATCVLRKKFSVSQFWNDCRKYKVTGFLYIGEILRYLCNTPKEINDKDHWVKFVVGSGLRADVWREFTDRFGKIKIYEFYGATEGNVFFFNFTHKVGAIGRYSVILKLLWPCEVIKFDMENNEPVRDHRGRCIKVSRGKPGLLIAKITTKNPFKGYTGNRSQTEKKILRNVFKKGDMYYNSGDMIIIDKEGFAYFHDRVGDTFRWKGENVSTTEVEDIISKLDFVEECNVFGIPVPYHEGKIGMVAIKLKEGQSFDGEKLYEKAVDYLPNYARPRFVRVQDSIDVSGTYKKYKLDLIKAGFNPLTVKDPLYFLDEYLSCYMPMDYNIYQSILEKKLKL